MLIAFYIRMLYARFFLSVQSVFRLTLLKHFFIQAKFLHQSFSFCIDKLQIVLYEFVIHFFNVLHQLLIHYNSFVVYFADSSLIFIN